MKEMKKRILLFLLGMIPCTSAIVMAQDVDETKYFLPRTAVKFTLLIEKSDYKPGPFSIYSERFLKKAASSQETTTWRIVRADISSEGVADPTKSFITKTDAHRNITSVNLANDGVLLSINTEPAANPQPAAFVPAPKPAPINVQDYMSQEILSAGSQAKMAELTAQEIYDIRESKSMLAKGQADYMPKDGEQLKLMLNQLNNQESILLQAFEGSTQCDTMVHEITIIPKDSVNSQLFFRFSRHFGMVDSDDLSGEPYFLTIEDLHSMPSIQVAADPGKKDKKGDAIHVNLPGKIRVTLATADKQIASEELYAAQYGRMEMLDDGLFSKKLRTSIVLDPATGNLESIKTEVTK
jgi:hypothetical protein